MPAIAYPLAPWVGQPADPAAHYATGVQIGLRIGAEQASNQMRQQQLLMEQQKMAFEEQYAQQKQALEVSDLIQKQRAAAAYQGLISRGVNPMQALEAIGPSMGMDPERLAGLQMNRERWQAQLAATQEDRAQRRALAQQREGRITGEAERRLAQSDQRIANLEAERQKRQTLGEKHEERMTAKDRAMALSKIEKDEELTNLSTDLKVARHGLDDIEKQRWWSAANKEAAKAKAQAHLAEVQASLSKRRQDLLDQYGVEMPSQPAAPIGEAAPTAPTGPSRAGDDTMPDAAPKRVRVKSPEGKIGTLPADQLDAALKAGYTQI